MNKTAIAIVVVLILVLGGGYVVYQNMPSSKTETAATTNTSADTNVEVTADSGAMKGSLKSLIAAGKSVKCTYQETTDQGSQEGTIYAATGHMYGDIKVITSPNVSYTMHMVNDGKTSYIWGGPFGEEAGIMMKVDATVNANTTVKQNVDLDKEMNFSCAPWISVPSLLTPPANVKFSDMSGLMMNINTNAGASVNTNTNVNVNANVNAGANPKIDCSVCNQIPAGTNRDECLAALKC